MPGTSSRTSRSRKAWTAASTSPGRCRRSRWSTTRMRSPIPLERPLGRAHVAAPRERGDERVPPGPIERPPGPALDAVAEMLQRQHEAVRVAREEDEPRVGEARRGSLQPVHVVRRLLERPRLALRPRDRARQGAERPGRVERRLDVAERRVHERGVVLTARVPEAARRVARRPAPFLLALDPPEPLELRVAVRAVGLRLDIEAPEEARLAEDRDVRMRCERAPEPRRAAPGRADDEVDPDRGLAHGRSQVRRYRTGPMSGPRARGSASMHQRGSETSDRAT